MSSSSSKDRVQDDRLSLRLEISLLVAILALAGVLRLGWPGLTEFKTDEAHLSSLALDMAEGKQFPLRGISSSVGFPNFPMSVWLYAIPLMLWKHVYAATLFTGLLNWAAVLGCYWLTRRYWGVRAALAATLMFAVSPWALHHSRKIWAQNLLPFFVTGWGISGMLAMVEGRSRFIIAHFVSLAVAVQTHLAGISLVPVTLIWLLLFRRRVHWRYALVGTAIAVVTTLPFAYYLLNTADVADLELGSGLGSTRRVDTLALRYAGLLSTGQEIHALTGPDAFGEFLTTVPDISLAQLLWGTMILGGIGRLIWHASRIVRHGQPAAVASLMVLVWLSAPLFLFSYPRLPIFLHYLLPLYPAQYIAAGALFSWLVRRGGFIWKGAGWALLTGSALAQVWVWIGLITFWSRQMTPGGMGVPLAFQLSAATLAKEMMVEVQAAEVLIAGKGESTKMEEFPAVYSVLLRSVPLRFVDATASAVFPSTPTIVLLDSAAGRGSPLYQAAAIRKIQVTLREGEGSLQILALPEASPPVPDVIFEPPEILANWAAFWGYDRPIPLDEDSVVWQVYWYAGAPSMVDYHMFNHLHDRDGRMVGQKDAPVFAPSQWHEKDVVVSIFELPWPSSAKPPFTIRTGMYSYPDLAAVLIYDVAGNPYTDAIEIPLN